MQAGLSPGAKTPPFLGVGGEIGPGAGPGSRGLVSWAPAPALALPRFVTFGHSLGPYRPQFLFL